MLQSINTAETFKENVGIIIIRLLQHVMGIAASHTTPSGYCGIMRSRNLKIKILHW